MIQDSVDWTSSSWHIFTLNSLYGSCVGAPNSTMSVLEAELAGVAGAAALAVWAKNQGPKCPFHRYLFFISSGAAVSGGLYIAYRLLKRESRGGKRPGGVLGLIRKNILELEPYRCARDDYSEGILLDANENSFGSALPSDHASMELERYPCPYQVELKEKIAKLRCVRAAARG